MNQTVTTILGIAAFVFFAGAGAVELRNRNTGFALVDLGLAFGFAVLMLLL